ATASELADFLALAFQQARVLETTRDENVRLESLRQAGLRLTESLKLNDVFHQVLDSALNLSERIDSVFIYIYQNDTLSLGRAFWRSRDGNSNAYPPRENGVHYAVARTGDAVVVEDIAQDTRFQDNTHGYSGSIVALPLKIGIQVIGVISVYSLQPRSITSKEISLMGMLSDQASLAVHNALLHEQMRLDMSQLDSLRQVSLYLTSQLELQPVLDVILEYTLALTLAQNAHIFLYDGEKLSFGAAMWEGKRKEEAFKALREDGLTYQVARSGQRVVVSDMNDHELYGGTGYTGAIVGLPLLVQGEVRGVMNVSYNQPHRFTDQELNLMELISDHAAIAIHNAWLYEQLQHHADVMEQQIAERTAELRSANERLKELDRLRGKFVSDLSHELRTPVSSLTVRLYLLERASPEQYPQHIVVLKNQIGLLNDFIQNAFDISRLDLEMAEATLLMVSVNQIITAAIAAYREVADSKGIQLLCDLDDNLPMVRGASNHLSQMVAHLINNALHYTTNGHVKVSTFLDEPREHICIAIEDTGIGIDAEDQEYIFDRFYRGKRVAQLIPGTGLGLSIVQAVVKLHNGWIKVESDVDKGSTFSVWLPVDVFKVKKPQTDA
ncbi:MAG: GAF domain-containing protein, partial [Anaerolineaceae bacterium]|nr:GAF domain-containing protein [Anaerolineaceae bacterium]